MFILKYNLTTSSPVNAETSLDKFTTMYAALAKPQDYIYNNKNRLSEVNQYEGSITKTLKFDYRPDSSKWRTRYFENNVLKYTKYHFGAGEKIVNADGTTKQNFYIFGRDELIGMTHLSTGNTPETYYPVQDHINTTWALLKGDGTFKEKYAYDPCSHFFERCMASLATKEKVPNKTSGAIKEYVRGKYTELLH